MNRRQQADLLVHRLHVRLLTNRWLGNDVILKGGLAPIEIAHPKGQAEATTLFGTMIRIDDDEYSISPPSLSESVADAVRKLNLNIAFTMCTHLTSAIFDSASDEDRELFFPCTGKHYQIVDSLQDIIESEEGDVKKLQYVCFVRRERVVLIWGDDEASILARGEDLLTVMLSHVSFFDTSISNRSTC